MTSGAPNLVGMKIFHLALALALTACLVFTASAGAEVKMKRLGEDPALDGPPALDLTYVDVGRAGDDLEIRLGMSGMTPGTGGYPALPGIEWLFEVRGRQFLAEAYVESTSGAFILFEVKDGVFEQVADLEGTYDFNDGYISMLVPLEDIGAKPGSRIAGAGENDADAHVHTGANTMYTDYLTTTKSFKVPKR